LGANFSDNTKKNTSRGAKMIFPSGQGAGFKMNWELLFKATMSNPWPSRRFCAAQ